ncbi:MAG: Ig-like domain-containing protein [Bacteroidetes bacterium]|nr:Ig-like domain-containing protein [Bacteroidota bacterium]
MCLVKVWRDRVVLQFVFLCVALLAYISESSALQIVQRDSSDDWKRASIEVSDVSFSSVVSSENSTSNVSNCTDNDRVTGDNIVPRQLVILRPFNNSWASHLSIDELKEGVAQSYSFRLSSAPSGPVTVKLLTTSYATTDGRGYLIEVWGSTVSIPRDERFHTFTFTTTDWCQPQVISFRLKKNSTVDAYVHKIKANFSVSGGGSFKGDHYIYWDKTIDDERSKRGIIVTPHPIEMGNAKKRTFQVKMAHAISVLVHVSLRKDAVEKEHGLILERVEDIPWITTRGSMFFNSNNWNVPQSVTIEAKDIVNRKPRHTFYIEAGGGGHDGYTRDVIVTFGNTTPTVNITGLPSKINSTDELTATFTFSKDVTGFETGDITVSGATKGTFSGSGKSYTLPLTPNGSEDVVVTVAKDAATAGTNTGPATPETATAKWDSDPPGVEITGLPPYINSTDPLTVNFTFTEDVTGFKTGDITVSGALKGAFGNGTSNTFSGNGTNYTLWITPNGRKDVVVTVVKDAATDGLNSGPAAPETATAVWDSDPPDVRITGLPSKINSTAELTAIFTFTEDVTGFETNDITVTGATKGKFSGSGSNYRLLITPNGSADVVVTVGANTATDGLNTGPADPETVTAVWDDATPDVTITGLPSKINSTAELTATFTFTEDVTEFETNDITVTGGTSGTFTATSATVYSLVITPTEDQNVVVTVSANAATNGLNTGPASDVTETAVWDDVTPDVTIAGLPSKINSTAELTATFTFTEDVTEFETNDITVTGGTSGTFTATSATVYSLVITPTEDQNVVVTVTANAATDGLNTGPASDVTETAVWDDVTPNVTITGLPPKINSTSPLTASFAFTEDVTGFITDDVKVSGATKGTFTANSATGYTLQIVPSGSGNMEVTVIANAASDGINTGPAQDVIATSVWDGANPGVTISGVPPKINSQEPFTATFTFSENVTGFIADDVVITGAAKGTWSANSATTYTLVITPSGAQDVVVTIPANVATDGTNQGPSKAVTKTAIWDADPPTVTISGLPENISTTDPLTATFTFSENVTEFFKADVTVTGATKGTFTAKSSSSYTLAITPTGQQDVVVRVPVNVATDGINMGPPQPVTVTSIWNSERMATLTVTSSRVEEGQSVQLSVNLSGAPFSRNVTIPLTYPRSVTNDDTATEPADYTQLRSVTIEAGSQTGSGSITTRDDDVYEGNEIFDVKLGTLPVEIKRGSPDLQTITIIENDTPPPVETTLRVDQTTVAEGGQVKVTARIAGALSYLVDVPLVYRAGSPEPAQSSDYTPVNTLTIEAGKTTAEGTINIKEDDLTEKDEVFIVSLGRLNTANLRSGNPSFQRVTIQDRTILPTVTLSASSLLVTEGETITVTVALSRSLSNEVTIPLTLSPVTATESEDYILPQASEVTISAGDTQSTLDISTKEDPLLEGDETFTIALGDLPSTVMGSDMVNVIIIDDELAKIIVSPNPVTIVEGGTRTIQVSLSAAPLAPITVTMSGYRAPLSAPSPPNLPFTDQNWNQLQEVTLIAEEDNNSVNETVTLTLTANGGGYVAVTEELPVTITDNDTPQLVVLGSLTVPEGGSASLDISLSSAPMSLATVTLSASENPDLTYDPVPLTFSTSDWEEPKTVIFRAEEDDDFEDDGPHEFILTATGYTDGVVTDRVLVTIIDNDEPKLKVHPPSLTIEEEGPSGSFQIALNGQPSSTVNISFSGYDGYPLRPPQNLTFTPTDWNRSKTVTLTALQDDEDFDSETFDLRLTGNGGDYVNVTETVSITIQDNDKPLEPLTVSINDISVVEDEEMIQLEVELSRTTEKVVLVQYHSSDGTAEAGKDYTASRGIVIFDPNATRGVIQFEIEDDGLAEPDGQETFEVTLSKPVNAGLGRAQATVTILDPQPVTTLRIEDVLVSEDVHAVTFQVHVFPPSLESITVRYQTEDGTATAGKDYQTQSGTLEFTPGMETMTIEVPLLGDETKWHTETFTMRLETSDPVQLAKAIATATITDDGLPLDSPENALIAYTIRFMRTSASEIIEGLGYRLRNQPSVCSVASRRETAQLWHSTSSWNPSLTELLGGCHITSVRGSVQVWGRGGYRRFQGFQREEDQLKVEADVSTAMAGVDYRWPSGWLTGVLVSHSRGEGSSHPYNLKVGTNASMTGVYPYLAYQRKTWGIWGTAGLGHGRTENDVGFNPSWRAGFGAIGVQGRMASVKALDLNYYGDVLMISTKLFREKVGITRIRAGLEASARLTSGLQPYVDAGVRQDAGSAENGVGLELGAGMHVLIPVLRLKGDLRTQRLMMHTADGFTEWGVSGSLEFGSRDKGVGLRVTPSWGPSQRRGITTQQTIRDVVPTHDGIYRTEMELGYGIPLEETVVRSVVGVTAFDQGTMYRLGGEVRSWRHLSVSAFGIVHAHATTPRNIGFNVQGLLQY